ncbi:MAG: hypothetical protein LAT68_07795 [Cyclobacteriaceae bacterium]|nr:hypothetical protein [Cyclobacteriaceae bacterium]
MKKVLTFILSVLLLFSLTPSFACDASTSSKCKIKTKDTTIKGTGATIVIPIIVVA